MTKITVVGAGFVGLTTAVCLADIGNNVICSEIGESRVQNLRQGILPFYEPNLFEVLRRNLDENRLEFTTSSKKALSQAEYVFICLPTPACSDGSVDTSFIDAFFRDFSDDFSKGTTVVMKSTVPIGYGEAISSLIESRNCTYVSNPEFLREGSAINDFMYPDRIVIGSTSISALEKIGEIYRPFNVPVIKTTTSSAELIKYASNGFLALKISFINEIAAICESARVDVREVSSAVGLDPRIGPEFLRPGPGWGGSCFPKDTKALLSFADKNGIAFHTLRAAIEANKAQKHRVLQKILKSRGGADFKVCVLGLSFKAGTDDLRESPAIEIAMQLIEEGVDVVAYDPKAVEKDLSTQFSNFRTVQTWQEAAQGADVIAILTEWDHFSTLDPRYVASIVRQRNVVDARNVLSKKVWEDAGFNFMGVGV